MSTNQTIRQTKKNAELCEKCNHIRSIHSIHAGCLKRLKGLTPNRYICPAEVLKSKFCKCLKFIDTK